MKTLQDFPEYVTATAKLAEVQARHEAAIAERDELLRAIEGTRGRTESLADQAQRLLSGDDSAVADVGTLRQQHARACRQVGLLAEVERLARQRVEDERATASREICEGARARFSKLVAAELRAARALLTAQQARKEFWQALRDDGVSMAHLPPVADLVKGTLNDPNATFWQRVADAERLSYVKPGELGTPPEVKPERMGMGRHIAAGPDGVREVLVDAAGKVTPGKRLSKSTPRAATWGDAA